MVSLSSWTFAAVASLDSMLFVAVERSSPGGF